MPASASPMAQYGFVVISIAVIIVLGIIANAVTQRTWKNLARKQYLSEPLRVMLHGITWWMIVIVVGLMILQQVGVRVIGLWAGLLTIAGMVTIGFIAVWSVLSNILCALLLLVFAPFRIGDEIEIIEATGGNGLRGKVVNLNILYTSLQEMTDEGLRDGVTNVPNNMFFQKTIRLWQGTNTTSLEANLFNPSSSEDS